ncbi:hypothetical protein GobsT_51680 [Gemmata obscuriglobus]|uniref:hypothetical protein n=1 Tax=Gemmata obscuriglobus TaxID=114 RepID=UPI00016C43FB|nr:hypothetical protein [Gemmata obscuriglobus]QEG30363.1 hypothetical protein GobsT_51680 [Gemmata obscuriglobus]VTS09687.1 unnamed protein product [Gemmata obscuriglobus UQM 2246]
MPSTRNPVTLTPDERARELARLLATGLVRIGSALLVHESPPSTGTAGTSDFGTNELADAREKSVTGTGG